MFSGGALAALAVAQYIGADPFSLLGWVPSSYGSERMRVFATLGNPNFVAAFLSGLLPLTFSLVGSFRSPYLPAGFFVLQAAALFATGSRAPVLGLAAAGLWLAILRSRTTATRFMLAALSITLLATFFSPARDLRTTLRGRLYVWKVAAPHLREHFLLGLGPGGFGAAFPLWETQYWQASPASERDRMFAGIEDHAHNDYLEILADYGTFGLLAFLTAVFAFLGTAWTGTRAAPDSLVAGASAGVVALLAVALVDFPLMRPAEAFLLWSLVAVSLLKIRNNSESLKTRE
jgi:O-antigen ligase